MRRAFVDAVEDKRMEVRRQVECRSEALDERDRAAQAVANPKIPLGTSPLIGEYRTQEATQHLARQPSVPGTAIPKWVGKREHPLSNRNLRKDAIDEVGRCIRHSPPATGGTEPAPLTREGNEAIVATCVAVDAQKAMSQHAALEVGTDLTLDEASDGGARGLRACDEGCELFTNDAMKESVLGLVAFVANRGVVAGTGLVLSLLSKRCAAWGGGDGLDSPCPLCISRFVRCRRHGFETDRPQADREP